MKNQAIKQEIEDKRMEVALETLTKSIARWTEQGEQHVTAVPGLSLFRRDEPTGPISVMYEPSVCLVAQGAKRVLLGDDTYVYDAHHYLITSVHLPTGNHLPFTCGRSRRASAPDCVGGKSESSDSAGDRLAEGKLHTAITYR